jgi:hypothetical protein
VVHGRRKLEHSAPGPDGQFQEVLVHVLQDAAASRR